MTKSRQTDQLFAGKSEMATRMRSHDWSQTQLGAVETWSQSLRSALSICLNSRFPIAIYWGSDYLLLYNDAWRPIVGDKHPWALGRPGREVWSEIWDGIGPELASVLATGEGIFHNDGLLLMQRFGYTEECFFDYTFNPIQGQGGAVDGVFNIVSETTYRVLNDRRTQLLREAASRTGTAKTAEEACALMMEVLKAAPADIPFALFYLIDPDGKYARLCRSSEFASNSPISPEVIDLAAEADTDAWLIALTARTARPHVVDDLVSRFGVLPGSPWSEPPQEAIVLPITTVGQSKVLGVFVAVASPRRRLDDNYRDFLGQVAAQIAIAIANARSYEEERKRAEALAELDRAKTLFFTNVSHEFRTPLTLMLSPLEDLTTVLEGRLQPDEREQFALVQRNGLRLQKLVNALLDFSRIEAGRIQAAYEPIDLATYTAELTSAFRSLMEQAGLSLVVECSSLPEAIYVDREMWEKIVLNLLSNAFKFTLTGTIIVRLQWLETQVALTILDTGVGIPSGELPHLFERFHRVENSQGRSFEGSGIGLSLVQELVNLHGGTIAVTSSVGQGSCFTVSIPTGYSHLPTDRVQATRTTATALGITSYVEEAQRWLLSGVNRSGENGALEGNGSTQLSTPHSPLPTPSPTARILLADDNADMRAYIQRLLSASYQVETVADGMAALSAVQHNPPDLVLSDVMMPRLDGFELLRHLRSDAQTQDIPIILLSARAGEEARIEGLEARADDYLIKPFSARELMARVEATLKLTQLRRTARAREQALQLETQTVRADLDRILSSLREGFLTLDRDWRYTYINARQLEIIGMSHDAVMGKNVWDVFPDIVGTEIYHQFHRVMNEKVTVQFEIYYPPLDGWFDHRVYPTDNGIAIFVADVSERARLEAKRKQAEQALRESEERFRHMADYAPMMVWVTDPDGYCTYLSKSWYDFTGQTEETGLGFGWVDATHPEDYEYAKNTFLAANERRDAFCIEYRLRRKDGEYRWAIDAANPWFGEDGTFKGYIGSVIDITDRKQAEMMVREAQDRVRLALESTDLGTWDLNPTTGELTWDEGCKAMFGLSQEADVNYDVFLAGLHPDDHDRTLAVIAAALDPAIRSDYDIEYRTLGIEDGVERWVAAKGKVYFSASELATRFIGTVLNITERKRAEAEREQLLQREKTAREEAETASRIKDEFLAVLSHELRTPMNPILGWSSLLRQGKLNATKTTQAIETIERNARIQVQLIDDLLDVSRILRGKLALNMLPVDLKFAIDAALETVRLAMDAKAIALQTHLNPTVGQVLGDAGRLQQVVWNLLSNAVKFTPSKGQITVSLTQVGMNAQIQVADTGKGIHADFLPYVFEHFRQEDAATTRRFGGLGLGLSIARQLVELHGGRLKVASDGEGQGATFTVKIPLLRRLASGADNGESEIGSMSSIPPSSLKGLHILVVDDEVDSLALVKFLLEQADAVVTSTSSGLAALQAVEHAVPDLIVSDIGMPEMDGYQLVQALRSLEQAKCIPAIALSAYAGEFDRQQAIAAGFQQHLSKPVEPEHLLTTIHALCSGSMGAKIE